MTVVMLPKSEWTELSPHGRPGTDETQITPELILSQRPARLIVRILPSMNKMWTSSTLRIPLLHENHSLNVLMQVSTSTTTSASNAVGLDTKSTVMVQLDHVANKEMKNH